MYWPGDGCEMTNPVNTSGPDNTGLTPRRSRALASLLDNLLRSKLWVQIVIAMIAGISLGIGLSPSGGAWISASAATIVAGWVALPGHLFLALIQMIVVPLIISSIILGIAGGGNVDFVRRIGLRIGPYFVATTIAAVAIGTSLAIWVAPGDYIDTALVAGAGTAEAAAPVVPAAQADLRPFDVPDCRAGDSDCGGVGVDQPRAGQAYSRFMCVTARVGHENRQLGDGVGPCGSVRVAGQGQH